MNAQENNSGNSSILLEFFRGFCVEFNDPFNGWVTGVEVGHPPTREEKLVHYVTHGGSKNYRERFIRSHPGSLREIERA